jgi:hypothetical protein
VTRETTTSLERELVPNVSLRGLWVYKSVVNETSTRGFVNVLRPYSVYDQVYTRVDPGPSGTGNIGNITVYDYNPAYRGASFVANEILNVPSNRNDWYHNFEVMLNKRPGGKVKWFANTSFLATRNHRWLEAIAATPNSNYFPLDETWQWQYRLAGGYGLPLGLTISTLFTINSGTPGQRTVVFRAVDPNGGPTFSTGAPITLRVEPLGAERLPTQYLMNLRLSKRFSRKLTAEVDCFNVLNTSVAFAANFQSGPTFGYVTAGMNGGIASPRILRVGGRFQF